MKRTLEQANTANVVERSANSEQRAIPETIGYIHFIWAGGEIGMPKENIATVAEWAKANPEFNTIIWVDAWDDNSEQIDIDRLDKILIYYQEEFKSSGIDVLLNDTSPDY